MPDPRDTHPYLRFTCHGMPIQIEGTTPEGEDVYFRYRWGNAQLEINEQLVWSARMGDDLHGHLPEDAALRLVAGLLDTRYAIIAIGDDLAHDSRAGWSAPELEVQTTSAFYRRATEQD